MPTPTLQRAPAAPRLELADQRRDGPQHGVVVRGVATRWRATSRPSAAEHDSFDLGSADVDSDLHDGTLPLPPRLPK